MLHFGLDISTARTGVAMAKVGSQKVKLWSVTTPEKDHWKRAEQVVNKAISIISWEALKYKVDHVMIYFEEQNSFLNARTVRSICSVHYPLLYILENDHHLKTQAIQVTHARKLLLKKPPYDKARVFDFLKYIAANNDEADALCILLASPGMEAVDPKKLVRRK